MRLDEKVIALTGAARGIGRATAEAMAREGADLILMDIARPIPEVPYPMGSESQLRHTAHLCERFGVAVEVIMVDLRDGPRTEGLMYDALSRMGKLDGLVNNAGIVGPAGSLTHQIDEVEWQVMIEINLTAAWRMMKLSAGPMIAAGAGSIVNVSSTAGVVGYRHFSSYVASKHALVGLTKAAALDLGPSGVRVNAVCPGSVRDDDALEGRMLKEIARSLSLDGDRAEEIFTADQPTDALVEADDVASTIVWLQSDESRHVNGSVVVVDGGYTSR